MNFYYLLLYTLWTWVWVNSGRWWWTGRPGVLWFMGSQRVRHDWVTELSTYRCMLWHSTSNISNWKLQTSIFPQFLKVNNLGAAELGGFGSGSPVKLKSSYQLGYSLIWRLVWGGSSPFPRLSMWLLAGGLAPHHVDPSTELPPQWLHPEQVMRERKKPRERSCSLF